jgi:hypothetical protein
MLFASVGYLFYYQGRSQQIKPLQMGDLLSNNNETNESDDIMVSYKPYDMNTSKEVKSARSSIDETSLFVKFLEMAAKRSSFNKKQSISMLDDEFID